MKDEPAAADVSTPVFGIPYSVFLAPPASCFLNPVSCFLSPAALPGGRPSRPPLRYSVFRILCSCPACLLAPVLAISSLAVPGTGTDLGFRVVRQRPSD